MKTTEPFLTPARTLDGVALASTIRAGVARRAAALTRRWRAPALAVLLVGDSPASAVYVRNKIRACEDAGVRSLQEHLPADTPEAVLLDRIAALNADSSVDGILVQLPLPPQIDPQRVIAAIAPDKDVDGFHVANAGALFTGAPRLKPCTPSGVMRMLEHTAVPIRGAEAVVIGASNIVGKPQAMLLLAAGATVTLCNSKTRELAAHSRRADILVVAVGRARMIGADMVKPGAVVIDVGMNRDDQGRLCGDVDTDAVRGVAGCITPVPGGVGPMTIAMLLENTLDAAEGRAPAEAA